MKVSTPVANARPPGDATEIVLLGAALAPANWSVPPLIVVGPL